MKTKQQFLEAVALLAPGDRFILDAAQEVPETDLPSAPGAAALEFVVTLERLRGQLAEVCPTWLKGAARRPGTARSGSGICAHGRRLHRRVVCLPVSWWNPWPARPVAITSVPATEAGRPGEVTVLE